MAVSKRLRFEVLRRDNHACRYCGSAAPDVKLTIDHVVPTALGGGDGPANLVTACAGCNAGKSSIQPGSDLIGDVENDALRWARALETAAKVMLAERQIIDEQLARFLDYWECWTYPHEITVPAVPVVPTGDALVDNWREVGGWAIGRHSHPVSFADGTLTIQVEHGWTSEVRREFKLKATRETLGFLGAEVVKLVVIPGWPGPVPPEPKPTIKIEWRTLPLPGGWQNSIERFFSLNLPESEIHRLIGVTMKKPGLKANDMFRYLCGCCWRVITDLQEDARLIIEAGSD